MGNIRVNLNTLYSEKIHVPTIKGSPNRSPLYAVNTDAGGEEIKFINRDAAWKEAVKSTYNSPTNVRRIILTADWVVLQFYKPFISNDKSSGEIWRYKDADPIVVKAVDSIVRRAKNGNVDLAYDKEDYYTITGNILQPIRSWILTNLEEIIIDETILFSESILNAKARSLVIKAYNEQSCSCFYNQQKLAIIGKIMPSTQPDDVRKQFPRLNCVSIIPNLSNLVAGNTIYTYLKDSSDNTLVGGLLEAGVTNETDSIVYRYRPGWKDDGIIRTRTYYKFDSLVLSEYARKHMRDVERARESDRAARAEAEAIALEESKCELEKTLDQIEAGCGINNAKVILAMTISNMSDTERNEIRKQFTPNGQRFW